MLGDNVVLVLGKLETRSQKSKKRTQWEPEPSNPFYRGVISPPELS